MIVLRIARNVSANIADSLLSLVGLRSRPVIAESYENHPYHHVPEHKPETWVFYCR